jgi:hypothetical protein
MSSPRDDAGAERETTALSPLPHAVVLHIFSLLPVDTRLRCAEVCRGWRSVLLERSLWTRLDMSAESGVHVREGVDADDRRGALDALLRCAAARAGGLLQSLDVEHGTVSAAARLEVVAANGSALRELRVRVQLEGVWQARYELEALLRAAPQLRVFAADRVFCVDVDLARRVLRNEPPFGPLRVQTLTAVLDDADEAAVMAFAADVAAHAWLTGLDLERAPLHTPAAVDAVVDAALARRLEAVMLYFCRLPPASAPALARLLSSDALTTLHVYHEVAPLLLDAPFARVVGAALRANSTLTSLTLENARVLGDAAAGAELLGALTGHASLQVLSLGGDRVERAHQAAAGAALGALVAANAPALTELNVMSSALGDAGLRPLFEALPRNTHLRKLCCYGNNTSEVFARDVLLPAVRANVSLRQLSTDAFYESGHAAVAVVNSRAAT